MKEVGRMDTSEDENVDPDRDSSDIIVIKTSTANRSHRNTMDNLLDDSTSESFIRAAAAAAAAAAVRRNTTSSNSNNNNNNLAGDNDNASGGDDDGDIGDLVNSSSYSGNGATEEPALIRIKDRSTECKEGFTVKASFMWRVLPRVLNVESTPLEVETPRQFSITIESISPVMTLKVAFPPPTEEITFEQLGPSTIILNNGNKGASGSFSFNVTMHYITRVKTFIAVTSYCNNNYININIFYLFILF